MIIAQQFTAGWKRRAPTVAFRRVACKCRYPNRRLEIQSSLRDFDHGLSPFPSDQSLGYCQVSLRDIRRPVAAARRFTFRLAPFPLYFPAPAVYFSIYG